jgi:hypothetical protein
MDSDAGTAVYGAAFMPGGERRNFSEARVRGWPLNCDVLPLNIKRASRFLRK